MNLALTLVLSPLSTTDTRHVSRTNDASWATTYGSLMGNVDNNAWSETDGDGWVSER